MRHCGCHHRGSNMVIVQGVTCNLAQPGMKKHPPTQTGFYTNRPSAGRIKGGEGAQFHRMFWIGLPEALNQALPFVCISLNSGMAKDAYSGQWSAVQPETSAMAALPSGASPYGVRGPPVLHPPL